MAKLLLVWAVARDLGGYVAVRAASLELLLVDQLDWGFSSDHTMARTVFHVGMPKTGTTFLQRAVFPKIERCQYLGKIGNSHDFVTPELGSAIDSVYSADSCFPDPAVLLRDALDLVAMRAGCHTLVLSTEALLHPATRDFGLVAARLYRARPEAHVLITIRSQESLALSWYRSHGRFGQYLSLMHSGTEQVSRFLSQQAWWAMEKQSQNSGFIAMLDYHAIVTAYRSLFGNRVHLLPLELLQFRREEWTSRLNGALETDATDWRLKQELPPENHGLIRRELLFMKLSRRFGVRAYVRRPGRQGLFRSWLASGPPADEVLDRDIREDIEGRFGVGNAILADKMGIELQKLGYTVRR